MTTGLVRGAGANLNTVLNGQQRATTKRNMGACLSLELVSYLEPPDSPQGVDTRGTARLATMSDLLPFQVADTVNPTSTVSPPFHRLSSLLTSQTDFDMVLKSVTLPPELLAIILRNLNLNDLHRCRLANTTFNNLVRPLLGRFLYFDDTGVTIPGTGYQVVLERRFPPIPPTPFTLEALELVSEVFERIDVRHHTAYDEFGGCCLFRGLSVQITSCRVLSIHLGAPADESGLVSTHPYAEPFDEDPAHPPLSHPADCHLLRTVLENTEVGKLVLRNVPIAYAGVDPDLLSHATSHTIEEVVIVFNGTRISDRIKDKIWEWEENYTCQDEILPCFDFDQRVIYDLEPIFLPNAGDFTFVFWTGRPAAEFATLCCSARDDFDPQDDGRPPHCDCPPSSPFHDAIDFERHYSCWEGGFLREISAAIAEHSKKTSIRKITIVNASAIVPDGSNRKDALLTISMGIAKHDTFEQRFRKAFQTQLQGRVGPDKAQSLQDRVEFKSMKDWLSTSAWEDVFDAKEVKPWMDFKRHAQITDWFKPESPDDVKWRKEVDGRERVKLIHRRISARRLKPSKNSWRH